MSYLSADYNGWGVFNANKAGSSPSDEFTRQALADESRARNLAELETQSFAGEVSTQFGEDYGAILTLNSDRGEDHAGRLEFIEAHLLGMMPLLQWIVERVEPRSDEDVPPTPEDALEDSK